MRRLLDTLGGLYELVRLAVLTRFRIRSPYWRWRMETAFGTEPECMPPRARRWRAVLHYGIWVHRMRRGR